MSDEEGVKQLSPPCVSVGAGDVTARQREAERREVLFKTPRTPASRGLNFTGQYKRQGTPRPKRSASLDDEASPRRQGNVSRSLIQRKRTPARQPMAAAAPPTKEVLAARRICQALVLNSYRRQRHEIHRLQSEHQVAVDQEAALVRKAETLRTLVDDEKERVKTAMAEVQRITLLIRGSDEEKEDLLRQKTELESEIERLDRREYLLQEKIENLQNNVKNVRNSCLELEARLVAERLKLQALEEQYKQMQEKIAADDVLTQAQDEKIKTLGDQEQALEARHAGILRNVEVKKSQVDACATTVASMQDMQKKIQSDHDLLTSQQASISAAILDFQARLIKQAEQKEGLDAALAQTTSEVTHLTSLVDQAKLRGQRRRWLGRVFEAVTGVVGLPFTFVRQFILRI